MITPEKRASAIRREALSLLHLAERLFEAVDGEVDIPASRRLASKIEQRAQAIARLTEGPDATRRRRARPSRQGAKEVAT